MRTTFRIYAAVAAAALGLLASCQQQPIGTPEKDGLSGNELVPVTLTASIAQTKVTYEETAEKNLQPDWEADDKVIGFDGNNANYEFTVSSVNPDGSATLTGVAPANCTLHLIYLCGAGKDDITSGSLSVDYNGQAGNKTIPAVMLADGEVAFGSGNFHFHNGGAVIGINATKGVPGGSTISKITVYGDNLSAATVGLTDGKLALTAGGSTGESISTGDGFSATVSSDGKGTLVGNPVLIAVPADAKVCKISVVVGSDNYIYTLQAPVTLARNEYKYVLGKTFKSSRPDGSLSKLFSVSADRQVYFSQGNLYAKKDGSGNWSWHFYDQQYKYNSLNPEGVMGRVPSDSDNEIDLFTWGYDPTYSVQPRGTGYVSGYGANENFSQSEDWGTAYCKSNGITPTNTWRTLTIDEWGYLINTNMSGGSLGAEVRNGKCKYGVMVCGKHSCIILAPDDWDLTTYPLQNTYSDSSTPLTWSQAEALGLVCLPASGIRFSANDIDYIDDNAYYWSSTAASSSSEAWSFSNVASQEVWVYNRSYGSAVRLVADTKPDPVLTVVGVGQEDYVSGGAL